VAVKPICLDVLLSRDNRRDPALQSDPPEPSPGTYFTARTGRRRNTRDRQQGKPMRKLLLILGLLALAIGLLWIGQGTGTISWPQSSFMIKQLQWAGYGAAMAALGLVLIWQSRR
jgi:hypothetical protein